MTNKIAFMKNVPQHGNLVAFYGFIDENDGQGEKISVIYSVISC
jgi:hypothetical protein